MNLSRFFIDRPIFAGVISFLIFLAGLISVFQLPISEYPEVVPATVVVSMIDPSWPAEYLAALKTYPDLLLATLISRGVSPKLLVAVPCPAVSKDRTYASALVLRDWLMRHHIACPALNVVTQGAHARRYQPD